MTSVPKLWPGSTIVCCASGPSLTPEDVAACRGQRVIVVNTTYRLAPWADVLYACDDAWWKWERAGVAAFAGLKFSIHPFPADHPPKILAKSHKGPDVTILRNTGKEGLETDPSGLRTGMNSGYQAVNLAYHLGAARIVLLGYDMQKAPTGREYWHPDHPERRKSPYFQFQQHFKTIARPLAEAGVEVVNCSRATALTCFPRRPLAEVLAEVPCLA